jgi:hypothetical protein
MGSASSALHTPLITEPQNTSCVLEDATETRPLPFDPRSPRPNRTPILASKPIVANQSRAESTSVDLQDIPTTPLSNRTVVINKEILESMVKFGSSNDLKSLTPYQIKKRIRETFPPAMSPASQRQKRQSQGKTMTTVRKRDSMATL